MNGCGKAMMYLFLKCNTRGMFDELKLGQNNFTLGQGTHFISQVVRKVLHNENVAFFI